tara:strand:- start:5 stop:124 length:120 start_codon:yes stop_codon:yes gene_type:complete
MLSTEATLPTVDLEIKREILQRIRKRINSLAQIFLSFCM